MNQKSFAYPIVFMIILTIIFTFVLSFLNYKTIDVIAFNQETDLRKTILYVFDIEAASDDPKDIETAFKDNIEEMENDEGERMFLLKKDGEIQGYAFPVGGTALWGSVEAYAAVSADYKTLLGVDFVSHSETPGLGGRISEEWYKDQFKGIDLASAVGDKLLVYKPAAGGNLDAIAGATQTSNSVADFLNKDIIEFIEKEGGGN